jgi:hypothetical protein
MSEDRRGVLEGILAEVLTPMKGRMENLDHNLQELKEQFKRIEDNQALILNLLKDSQK